jgi:8-oxo-dGTP diphosphatase
MIEVVCGLIEDNEGRVLACLRPEGKHLGGKWEFPGGKIDPGETPEAALIRELQEELGVEVRIEAEFTPVEWDYSGRAIRLIPFCCAIISGTPTPLEHADIRWISAPHLGELDWAEADGPILAEWLATRAR